MKAEDFVGGKKDEDNDAKIFPVFPKTFMIKKKSLNQNSVFYPVTPIPVNFSFDKQTLKDKEEEKKKEKNKKEKILASSRTPNYICSGSYKANFFSSRTDKALQRFRLN